MTKTSNENPGNHDNNKSKSQTTNLKTNATAQQLRAIEQQLRAANQQLKATEQELSKSREQYKTVFDGMLNAVVVYSVVDDGKDFVIKNLNPSAEEMDKIKKDDVIGKSVLEVFPHIKQTGLFDVFQRVYKTGKAQLHPDVMYEEEKIVRWRKNYIFKLPSGDIVEVYRDITERKQAEQTLKHSEAIYRKTIENAQGVPYQLRCSDDKYDFIGSGIEELIGIPAEKLTRQNFNELIEEMVSGPGMPEELVVTHHQVFIAGDEDSPSSEKITFRDAIIQGKIDRYQVDIRIKTPQGQIKWLSDCSLPIKDEKTGEVVGFFGVLQDITERKLAQQAIESSEAIYRQAIENAQGVPYKLRCADDKYDFYGAAIEQIVGIPAEQMSRTKFNALIEEIVAGPGMPYKLVVIDEQVFIRDDSKGGSENLINCHDALKQGMLKYYQADVKVRTPQGQVKWLSDRALPVFDEKTDRLTGFIGIVQDITERKLAEQKLLDYQTQLNSLASQLSLAEERERRRIATELHDQIGQSLVVSKIKLEVLRNSLSSKDFNNAVDEVCNSLAQTIENTRLLTFDLSYPILYELGFEAAVAEWLDEQIHKKHNIKTEFEDDGQPKPLNDDIKVLLFRNVRELLINVVKHANATKVKVSIKKVDNEAQVSIEDNGVGFDINSLTLIATQTGGFGLFSIRQRLEQLGGRLQVKTKPGHGCKVTMNVPLKR